MSKITQRLERIRVATKGAGPTLLELSSVEAAARVLSIRASEVVEVYGDRAGVVILTRDGIRYVYTDKPDGNGRTGLLVYDAPTRYEMALPRFKRSTRRSQRSRGRRTGATQPTDLDAQRRALAPLALELERELAEIDEGMATGITKIGHHPSQRASVEEQLRSAQGLLRRTDAQILAREHEAHPQEPDAQDVRNFRVTLRWANAVLAADSERDVIAATEDAKKVWPAIALFNPALAALDRDAAIGWLQANGIDPDGDMNTMAGSA